MNGVKRILVAVVLSAAIMAALSIVPQVGGAGSTPLKSVFQFNKAKLMNEDNVVDIVSGMQLHLRLRKVEINHTILSIDISSNASSVKADILNDLYEVPKYIFDNTTNVNQVFVRVMDARSSQEAGSGLQLIAALDAKRDNWLPSGDKAAMQSVDELSQYLQSHYRITYTARWNEKFDIQT